MRGGPDPGSHCGPLASVTPGTFDAPRNLTNVTIKVTWTQTLPAPASYSLYLANTKLPPARGSGSLTMRVSSLPATSFKMYMVPDGPCAMVDQEFSWTLDAA